MKPDDAPRSEPPHVEEWLAAEALDALSPDEQRRVAAHLAECDACRRASEPMRAVATALAADVLPVAVPSSWEMALMARVAQEPRSRPAAAAPARRPRWRWRRLGLAAAAVAFVALLVWNIVLQAQLGQQREQVSALQSQLERESAVTALLAQPATNLRVINPGPAAPAVRGRLIVNESGEVCLLVLDSVPALPEDRAYQVWLIVDGQRTSAGLFRPDPSGRTTVVLHHLQIKNYHAIGVSVEPMGGSPQPTGPNALWVEIA